MKRKQTNVACFQCFRKPAVPEATLGGTAAAADDTNNADVTETIEREPGNCDEARLSVT